MYYFFASLGLNPGLSGHWQTLTIMPMSGITKDMHVALFLNIDCQ